MAATEATRFTDLVHPLKHVEPTMTDPFWRHRHLIYIPRGRPYTEQLAKQRQASRGQQPGSRGEATGDFTPKGAEAERQEERTSNLMQWCYPETACTAMP
jgi:hypothetical protein